MNPQGYYLYASSGGWSLIALRDNQSAVFCPDEAPLHGLDRKAVIRALASTDQQKRTPSQRLIIGVPAQWCLCATVDTEGLPRSQSAALYQALTYRLEAQLPITAEQCAFGFVGDQSLRLGIALHASHIEALLHDLEDAGHHTEAIVPRAFLAWQGWESDGLIENQESSAFLIWPESDPFNTNAQVQYLHLDSVQSPLWRTLESKPDQLAQQIGLDLPPTRVSPKWHVDETLIDTLREARDKLGIEPEDDLQKLTDSLQAETQAAKAILDHRSAPRVSLAQGPLAPRHQWRRVRGPAWASIAAAIGLLLACIAVLQLRAADFKNIADTHDAQSRAAFTQAMPGQAVPTSPQMRLRNRVKQLRGEQGLSAGDELRVDSTPMLLRIVDALSALPENQRFVITDLRLEENELRLSGHARSHGEADQLADALRRGSSYIVEPPSTDNLREGGVRFTLQARYQPNLQAPEPRSPDTESGDRSLARGSKTESQP